MSADIFPMPPVIDEERLAAYYIALSVQPEIVDASALVRTGVVNRVVAGMRLHHRGNVRATVAAIMAQDNAIAREKGWLW
jgi:hypothetical protein